MRSRNKPAWNQLAAVLARRAAASTSDVAEQLGVSIPTLHRLLQELEGKVVSRHSGRYALRACLCEVK